MEMAYSGIYSAALLQSIPTEQSVQSITIRSFIWGALPHNKIYGRGMYGRGTFPRVPLYLTRIAPNVKFELYYSVMYQCVLLAIRESEARGMVKPGMV